MNTPDDARLRETLADAVEDVHPEDRLTAIRQAHLRRSRRQPLVVLGSIAATVAVVSGIAWASGTLGGGEAPPVAERPSGESADEPVGVRVFYVGDTPQGPRLFSEVREVSVDADPQESSRALVLGAATSALALSPLDPDYEIPWPTGSRVDAVEVEAGGPDGLVRVQLSEDVPSERPDPMTPLMAELAVQQVVHTVAAALGASTRVEFRIGDEVADQVLGVDTSAPKSPADPLEVLAHVQVAEPVEGASVSGALAVSGWASSVEATVPWQIRSGSDVVLDGFLTAEGWLDDLFPYAGAIDLAELEPGTYTLVVYTDDASGGGEGGGEEGAGPTTDTRTFTIR